MAEPAPLVMSPLEIERLLPLAIQDLLDQANIPYNRYNPAKFSEWEAQQRCYAEAILTRVCELYRAHIDFKLEMAKRCAS
jgi:hypothetical protein